MTASKCNKLGMERMKSRINVISVFCGHCIEKVWSLSPEFIHFTTVRFLIFETKLTIIVIIIIINSPRSSCRKKAYMYWLF